MLCKARLEVGSLVAVNDILFGQFVEHGGNFRKKLGSCGFLRKASEALYRVTGGFGVIFIVLVPGFCLTDTLQCRLVMCHFYNLKFFVARRGIEPLLPE